MQPDTDRLDDLTAPLLERLQEWAELGIAMLPNAVLALVVVGLGWLLSGLVGRLAGRALDRISANRQVNHMLCTALRAATLGVAGFGALSVLHLDGVVTSMLAGVGVVGLALGFAFKDIAANLMSGVLMAVSRPFHVGDLVDTAGFFGTIERVDLRTTQLRTPTGELVVIPNQDVCNQPVTNFTETPSRRIDLEVGVGYQDDLEDVRDALIEALCQLPFRDAEREIDVHYQGFGGSSVDMTCRIWLDSATQVSYLQARSEAVIAVKKAIDSHGFHIPFPIRTLDFGASPVGGERLDTVLRPVFGEAGH